MTSLVCFLQRKGSVSALSPDFACGRSRGWYPVEKAVAFIYSMSLAIIVFQKTTQPAPLSLVSGAIRKLREKIESVCLQNGKAACILTGN